MEEIRPKAAALLARCDVVNLASLNRGGYPRPVPVKPLRSEGDNVVWMATGLSSEKTAEFRADPRAGLSYFDAGDSVVLTGTVEIFSDRDTLVREWQEWMRPHFPGGASDPDYCLLRFTGLSGSYYIGGEFVRMEL